MPSNIETKVADLRKADKEYYTDGSSSLSDQDYDLIKEEVSKENPDHPYLDEVGAEDIDNSHWEKSKHEFPLGSLSKSQSIDELKKWYPSKDVVLQVKLDGISIALTYENHKLVRAITRGRNGTGDDITRNVRKMKGIPEKINSPDKMIVRGEIVMTYEDFAKLPANKKKKNARNTASGAAKKLNGELCPHLTVIVYDVMNAMDLDIESEMLANKRLRDEGFTSVVDTVMTSVWNVLELAVIKFEENRAHIPYDIDGLVIKENIINFNDDWKHPKSKVAYKFAHQEVSTILEGVFISVKGARIQPIAMLKPVDVGGVTVSKASLHNWQRVADLNLSLGATVLVSRRNDVIPQVEQVLKAGTTPILAPTECPVCGTKLEYEKNTTGIDSAFLICPNEECEAKVVKHIMKWLRIHDTKGIAEKTVQLLYDNDIFEDLASFLGLHDGNSDAEMTTISGMGDSKIKNLRDEIKKTLTTNPIKFFAGLNLNGFGRGTFENICEYLISQGMVADYTNILMVILQPFSTGLSNVEGFARPSAEKLKETIAEATERIGAVHALVEVKPFEMEKPTGNSCAGKSFCFTGALEIVRSTAEKFVIANGGSISSVSKNLSYLVTDDPIDSAGGSNKMQKACKLGIPIISGDDFNKMITGK